MKTNLEQFLKKEYMVKIEKYVEELKDFDTEIFEIRFNQITNYIKLKANTGNFEVITTNDSSKIFEQVCALLLNSADFRLFKQFKSDKYQLLFVYSKYTSLNFLIFKNQKIKEYKHIDLGNLDTDVANKCLIDDYDLSFLNQQETQTLTINDLINIELDGTEEMDFELADFSLDDDNEDIFDDLFLDIDEIQFLTDLNVKNLIHKEEFDLSDFYKNHKKPCQCLEFFIRFKNLCLSNNFEDLDGDIDKLLDAQSNYLDSTLKVGKILGLTEDNNLKLDIFIENPKEILNFEIGQQEIILR